MTDSDVRWIQRFSNFKKALSQLTRFIEKGELNEFEVQGLIQSFEYNYELSWNVIKDFYQAQGEVNIQGSRDAIRLAFNRGLIDEGDTWMKMVKSRTLTSHTYNEDTAQEISEAIISSYYSEFVKLKDQLEKILNKDNSQCMD
jgi:nucleotidyltransferase substrate binding protein (TIGR01987 family)